MATLVSALFVARWASTIPVARLVANMPTKEHSLASAAAFVLTIADRASGISEFETELGFLETDQARTYPFWQLWPHASFMSQTHGHLGVKLLALLHDVSTRPWWHRVKSNSTFSRQC